LVAKANQMQDGWNLDSRIFGELHAIFMGWLSLFWTNITS
jgi:hypothetical protein